MALHHRVIGAWRLLARDNARQSADDELRQVELCRYMWWMRHAALAAVLAIAIRDDAAGWDARITAAALGLGLAGHLLVRVLPTRVREVTAADIGLLIVLAALGLPTAAVLLTSVAILGWAATFRPAESVAAYTAVVTAVVASVTARDGVDGTAALLGFCLLGAVFTIRMIRLSMAGRRAADRERLVERGIDAVLWEELPGDTDAFKVSAAAERLLGHPAEAWATPGFWRTVVLPADRPALEAVLTARTDGVVEFRCRTADGRIRTLENRVSVVADRGGRPAFLAGVMIDRTDIAAAEREALVFGHLVASSPIGQMLLYCGGDGPVVEAMNQACHRILGIPGDVDGRLLSTCGIAPERFAPLERTLREGPPGTVEMTGADGLVYQVTVRAVDGATCSVDFLDVTERVAAGRLLHAQARQDDLTGLPNRRAFDEAVARRLADHPDAPAGVLVLDLGDFRDVNDSLGHPTGDLLLRRVGERLAGRLRDGDILARLGGDEFAVLLPGADTDATEARARDLVRAVNEPMDVDGLRLRVRASAGFAAYPWDASDAPGLVSRADGAMYLAKDRGSWVERHMPGAERLALDRLALGSELDRAIDRDELVLRHQPLVDVATGAVAGTEALVRWNHPVLGELAPDAFIPLAEASGQIRELTRWVLARGLEDLRALGQEGAHMELSVNLSARNLFETDLLPWVLSRLAATGIAPARLVLEITESVVMDNEHVAVEVIRGFREHGVRVWIDDFGTGHSSLARLRDLPVDGVKIDRAFVRDAAASDAARTLLRSLVDLVGALGLTVVAEGVEDAVVLDLLAELRCPLAQGFHLGRPTTPAGLKGLLVAAAAA